MKLSNLFNAGSVALAAMVSLTPAYSNGGNEGKTLTNHALKAKIAQKNQFFVKNEGQVTTPDNEPVPGVKYSYGAGSVNVYFQQNKVSYVYPKKEYRSSDMPGKDSALQTTALYRMDMVLKGANPGAELKGAAKRASHSNYFTGQARSAKVPHYGKLVYEDIYEGIDLVYKFKKGQLKYEFVVHEGADPEQIRMRYKGAESLKKAKGGGLALTNPFGKLNEAEPVAFTKGNKEQKFPCEFVVGKKRTASFELKEAPQQTYVIDPYINYSTFLGGASADKAWDVAVNDEGSDEVYVAGETSSSNFPSISGKIVEPKSQNQDGFLAQYDANGNLNWFSYYGRDGTDQITGIDIRNGSSTHFPYVVGFSNSDPSKLPGSKGYTSKTNPNGPNGSQNYVFVAQFFSSGSPQAYAVLGSDQNDRSGNIQVNGSDFYITGYTNGSNFDLKNPTQSTFHGNTEGIVAYFSDLNNLTFSTFFGGGGFDYLLDIGQMPNGDLIVKGFSNSSSTNSPQIPNDGNSYQSQNQGGFDHILARFDNVKNFKESTYLGGSNAEQNFDFSRNTLAIDEQGYIHITGQTQTPSTATNPFPVTSGAYKTQLSGNSDMMYARFADMSTLDYATYIGGSSAENGTGIVAFDRRDYLVAGNTNSTDATVSTKAPSLQYQNKGQYDGYMIRFKDDGLAWGSYYGGSSEDRIFGMANSPDQQERFVAGETASTDWQTTNNAHQTNYGGSTSGGSSDAFLLSFLSYDNCRTPGYTKLSGNTSGTLTGNYKVTGDITVPAGNTLTIDRANLVFENCTQLIVEGGATLQIDRASLRACDGDDLNYWKGILVKSADANVTINKARIEDAKVALEANDPQQFKVTNSRFYNNLFYVALRNYNTGSQMAEIGNNTFRKQDGRTEFCSNYTRPLNYQFTPFYKMIYVINSQNPNSNNTNLRIHGNTLKIDGSYTSPNYDGYLGLAMENVQNAIHGNNYYRLGGVHPTIFTRSLTDVAFGDDVIELTEDRSGLVIDQGQDVAVQDITIEEEGGIYGIRLKELSKPSNGRNRIHGGNIDGCQTGIRMKAVKGTLVDNNTVSGNSNGISYYANQNFTNGVTIDHNRIDNNRFGVVVAPSQHPENNNTNANTSTNQINLDITCNKFFANEVGIFGSGNLKNQGNSSTPAGNNFDNPNNTTNNVSTNTEWDILWQYRSLNKSFTYYHYGGTIGYQPNSSSSLNYGTYTMNGNTHPCSSSPCNPGDSEYLNNTASKQGCYANWQMKRGYSSKESLEQPKAIKLFPNPFQNHITIRTKSIREGRIRVMNMVGQQMVNKSLQNQAVRIETGDWLPGTYVVKLIGENGILKTRKMVKTQ